MQSTDCPRPPPRVPRDRRTMSNTMFHCQDTFVYSSWTVWRFVSISQKDSFIPGLRELSSEYRRFIITRGFKNSNIVVCRVLLTTITVEFTAARQNHDQPNCTWSTAVDEPGNRIILPHPKMADFAADPFPNSSIFLCMCCTIFVRIIRIYHDAFHVNFRFNSLLDCAGFLYFSMESQHTPTLIKRFPGSLGGLCSDINLSEKTAHF